MHPNVIGVDVGGSRIRVLRAGEDALDPAIAATPRDLSALTPLVSSMVADVAGGTPPHAIGVGCAGLVDHPAGVLRWMPHAIGQDIALGRVLRDRFQVPVWVDNDANAAALAEATTGAGAGHRMVLVITLGTGIGAGLVLDGEVVRGRGYLGEVGHMRLTDDTSCVCGRIGCWETLVSGRVLDAAARLVDPDASGADLMAMADAGNPDARGALDRAGTWLGVGLANLVLALDPDVIVLGGGVSGSLPALMPAVWRYLESDAGGLSMAGVPPIVPARFGAAAGLRGAMIGAMEVSA